MTMQDEFKPGVTIDGFLVENGKRQRATLLIDGEGITANEKRHIPWRGVALKRDGADGAVLVVGKKDTVGSEDPQFLRAIESAAGNDIDKQLSKLQGLPTGFSGSQFIGCLVFFGLMAFMIMSIPGCYRASVDKAVDQLPYSFDEDLGETAQEGMEDGDVVEDEVVQDAIEAMVERLSPQFEGTDVPSDDVTWVVRVVENDVTNAYALPGGYITVYTGLIKDAESADMVAGVIGHEMAHVMQRHGFKRIANQVGIFAGVRLILGDAGGLLGLAGQVAALAAQSDFSQDQETEADKLGTEAMVRAGLDPEALGQFFALLKEKYGDQIPPNFAWLMSSHPTHDSRTDAIAEIVGEMEVPEAEPLDIDWADIQSRVGADDE